MPRIAAVLAIAIPLLAGCTVTDHRYADSLARYAGFDRLLVKGDPFDHVVWLNRFNGTGDLLHVYIEGDGEPWIRQLWVATDPTPEQPLMLALMQSDRLPGLYLGRPCYFGLALKAPCEGIYWTHARYSETVVRSMQLALKEMLRRYHYRRLVFIGHSGGGALAMLLAERFPQTVGVVTLAGNLDTDRWTRLHGYERLVDSLNPATRPPLPASVWQLHLAGSEDHVIPPAIIRPVVERQPNARFEIMDGYSHTCCWQQVWPDVLARIPANEPH